LGKNRGQKDVINMRVAFDQEKFDSLALHIASTWPNPRGLGAARLGRILYLADALHYLTTGQPLTGATYVKTRHGPAPRELEGAERRLVSRQALAVHPSTRPLGSGMRRYRALREPDLGKFTPEQINLVDRVIRAVRDGHADDIIGVAGHHHAWQTAGIGEELPCEAILVSRFADITPDAVKWAEREIERHEHQTA
jgi:hypothetical protein